MNQVAGEPKGDPFSSSPFTFPSSHTPPFIFRFTWGAGQEGGEPRRGRGRRGEARNAHLLWPTPEPAQPPPPAAAAAAAKPLRSPCTEAARSERSPGPRYPPAPRLPTSPELSVAPTSPAGAAGPARASPRGPRPLSNPLGSRRLLREARLAAAGARAARLRAGRRGARYGEPSNETRAGAQRRRVLAERGRGAAAATAVAAAAGAQGPLHHWQPWSPSIFLPRGRRSARHTSSGEEGRRAAPAGGGTCAGAEGRARVLFSARRLARHRAAPATGRERGRGPRAAVAPSRGGGGQTGLVQRLQPTPFKEMRGGVGRWRRGAGRGSGRASGEEGAVMVGTRALLGLLRIPGFLAASREEGPAPQRERRRRRRRVEL